MSVREAHTVRLPTFVDFLIHFPTLQCVFFSHQVVMICYKFIEHSTHRQDYRRQTAAPVSSKKVGTRQDYSQQTAVPVSSKKVATRYEILAGVQANSDQRHHPGFLGQNITNFIREVFIVKCLQR